MPLRWCHVYSPSVLGPTEERICPFAAILRRHTFTTIQRWLEEIRESDSSLLVLSHHVLSRQLRAVCKSKFPSSPHRKCRLNCWVKMYFWESPSGNADKNWVSQVPAPVVGNLVDILSVTTTPSRPSQVAHNHRRLRTWELHNASSETAQFWYQRTNKGNT